VNDGATDGSDLVNSSGTIFKNGYTMGQFAKYVRPGKVRISSTYNPNSNVFVTAYRNNGIVVVAINTGSTSVSQTFSFANITGLSTMNVNRTSSSQNMAGLGTATLSNNSFTYSLPAQSITTFHQF
jgi:glucuronoarabinoxylan endo-1,4-beta-xylanase